MLRTAIALILGFILDMLLGDPSYITHPVVLIGRLISFTQKKVRAMLPEDLAGERTAGGIMWLIVCLVSYAVPAFILRTLRGAPLIGWLLALVAEAVMCWLILAARSLKDESMKVHDSYEKGDIEKARHAVSMIVGRDTERLDGPGIIRAAVETVAENTSDGIIAPMFYIALGGAPLGFLYKAVNTMDSMVGYTDEPYTNIGYFPAKLDDIFNFIPARISALLMLAAGRIMNLDVKRGWKIFVRDRYNHASPNSAQTESVCAGLLGLRLAGDAWYHGVLHEKLYIGDETRQIENEDIPLSCRLMYVTSTLMLGFCIIMMMFV